MQLLLSMLKLSSFFAKLEPEWQLTLCVRYVLATNIKMIIKTYVYTNFYLIKTNIGVLLL